jgi:hypothetical protein
VSLFSTTALDQMLDALNGGSPSSIILYASLHTAYSATGTNEVSGGSYARIQLGTSGADWSSASAGSKLLGTAPSAFNVPASTTVQYVGFWSTLTSGTFAGMGPVGAGTVYAYTATDASPAVFTAPSSSYSNGNQVVLFPGDGGSVPGGFTAGTVYYVVSASTITFSLSATSGGSAINSSSTGSGLVLSCAPETFGSAGTLQLTTSTALSLF